MKNAFVPEDVANETLSAPLDVLPRFLNVNTLEVGGSDATALGNTYVFGATVIGQSTSAATHVAVEPVPHILGVAGAQPQKPARHCCAVPMPAYPPTEQ